MAGVAFAVEGDGVGFATESYAASALYTMLASLSGALWRIRRAKSSRVSAGRAKASAGGSGDTGYRFFHVSNRLLFCAKLRAIRFSASGSEMRPRFAFAFSPGPIESGSKRARPLPEAILKSKGGESACCLPVY
jgi:hypothetical protein